MLSQFVPEEERERKKKRERRNGAIYSSIIHLEIGEVFFHHFLSTMFLYSEQLIYTFKDGCLLIP
jgi:hypothetical protein